MMHDAADDAVLFHLPQLLDQHFLRDGRDRAFEIGKPQNIATEQMEEDHKFPATLKHLQRLLDALRCCGRGQIVALTFW